MEVVDYMRIAFACIARVDVGVRILFVDNPLISYRNQSCNIVRRHIQGSFNSDAP